MEINGSVPILGRVGEVQRWEHPDRQVLIDIDYNAEGVATITRDGLTALLTEAGWRRVK